MTTAALTVVPSLPVSDSADAVEPACPSCGYLLLGLAIERCPECGRTFRWEEVVEISRARRDRVFEHACFHWPVSSFVRTLLASVRPSTFWRRVGDGRATKSWALWLYLAFVAGLAWLVTVGGFAVTGIALHWMERAGRSDRFWPAGLLAVERALTEMDTNLAAGMLILPWVLLIAASAALGPRLLWQSVESAGGERAAVLRVAAYSAWPMLAWTAAFQALFIVGNVARIQASQHSEWMGLATACYALRRLVTAAAPIVWILVFQAGLRAHLRIPVAWTAPLAMLLIASLAGWIVWVWEEIQDIGGFGPGYQMFKRLPALLWPAIPM